MTPKFFIAIIAIFLSALPVRAADIQWLTDSNTNLITFEGEFSEGDLQKLTQIVNINYKNKNSVSILFNSYGGSIPEAIKIGQYIRQKKFRAYVEEGKICYSACLLSFIGGIDRAVVRGGRIGINQFYDTNIDNKELYKLVIYTHSMGTDIEIIEIAQRTLKQDMYIFNEDEQYSFDIAGDAISRFFQEYGWSVKEHSFGYCSMDKVSEINKQIFNFTALTFIDFSDLNSPDKVALNYIDETGYLGNHLKEIRGKAVIELIFDKEKSSEKKHSIEFNYTKQGDKYYVINTTLQKETAVEFLEYHDITLLIDGKPIDTLNLDGAKEAFQVLERCSDARH